MTLTNQRAVVFGGTSGIGLATAKALVDAGADVVIASRQSEKVANALKVLEHNATGEAVDATSAEQVRAFFQRVGPFDHLIITLSSSLGAGELRTLDTAVLRRAFEGKFWAHLTVAQASLETLRPDGSLTLVTAASARGPVPGASGLGAINGALEAMIPSWAAELQPLRVNAVSPGVIATPWWDNLSQEQREALWAQYATQLPVKRVGQPEDVAQTILFLINNTFITGSIIDCNGGAYIK
jgi:NAD(P)-dependent dehydrogenase (short-subunit alcohol dehydrogenase family)